MVWASSAFAALASGALFATGGYLLLALVSGTLVIVPAALLLLRLRRSIPAGTQ